MQPTGGSSSPRQPPGTALANFPWEPKPKRQRAAAEAGPCGGKATREKRQARRAKALGFDDRGQVSCRVFLTATSAISLDICKTKQAGRRPQKACSWVLTQ